MTKTVRLQVVEAVSTALGTAVALTVHRNLDYALEDGNLPVLLVQSGDDVPEDDPTQSQVMDQTLILEITVLAAASADPESAADAYEATLHAALCGATAFGGHAVRVDRLGGSWAFDLGDIAARTLRYRIGYRTRWADLTSA